MTMNKKYLTALARASALSWGTEPGTISAAALAAAIRRGEPEQALAVLRYKLACPMTIADLGTVAATGDVLSARAVVYEIPPERIHDEDILRFSYMDLVSAELAGRMRSVPSAGTLAELLRERPMPRMTAIAVSLRLPLEEKIAREYLASLRP